MHAPCFPHGSGLYIWKQRLLDCGLLISVPDVCLEPPRQYSCMRRGWEGGSGPNDPTGGASPLGDLGAVLSRFPEPNPAGATPAGTPGSPLKDHSVPRKKVQARSRPRSSDAATNRGGVSSGRGDVAPGRAALRAGRPPGTPPPAGPLRAAREARRGQGLCKVAAPPVVQLRLRPQRPLSEPVPRGESTDRLLSVIFLESVWVWCTNQQARGRVSRCGELPPAPIVVLQPWWRKAFRVGRRGS